MPAKLVIVPGVGEVALYKRKGVNGVRMTITNEGKVRVSLPTWAPYRLGLEFVRNKSDWISQQRKPRRLIRPGDRIGKAHRFEFETKIGIVKPKIRILGTDIRITIANNAVVQDPLTQLYAEKGAIRALKKEAEQLLPQRLATLASMNGFTYSNVSVKRLRSRWGSCNEKKEIILNCFLMQLPWHLIDYVLVHELVHTQVLRHGEPFWSEMAKYVKDLKVVRKEIKTYQPAVLTIENPFETENSGLSQNVIIN